MKVCPFFLLLEMRFPGGIPKKIISPDGVEKNASLVLSRAMKNKIQKKYKIMKCKKKYKSSENPKKYKIIKNPKKYKIDFKKSKKM